MEVILVLTQLREMVRSKVLRAAPRTLPLDLTRSLAIPQAVITRQLVLVHSAATQAAVITQPLLLALSFLIPPGPNNTAIGFEALFTNNTGFENAAIGSRALFANTSGFHNTADGFFALSRNTTGNHNTAIGDEALGSNTTGNFNTTNGGHSLENNTTGNGNTALGFGAGDNVRTANNVICIGAGIDGANLSNSCFIGSIFGQTSSGGAAVFINSSGKLGTITSSRRFKEEIRPMAQSSEVLFALKPVIFRYKKEIEPQKTPQFGLVAEDVEAVSPDLVIRDNDGKVNTVRYEAINAMLLNEFLKEHRTVQDLKQEISALAATVKQQTAQIQKVSARIEASEAAPQITLNSQ